MKPAAPAIAGLAASTLQLPPGSWATVLDCLCAHFPAIPRAQWLSRFERGRVLDAQHTAIAASHPYRAGLVVHYFREVEAETVIPFEEQVLHVDQHLVVADKPHFLPVTPGGGYVEQTLLTRLIRRLGNPQLVPLHRIDRGTAGLVLFSANPASRAAYQALFRGRAMHKRYEALAAPLPQLEFPLTRRSRIDTGDPFFRMQEVEGEPNCETRVEVIERGERRWRYGLAPVTGRKHQLRVHMAALGAPILNDDFYPQPTPQAPDDYANPLQLLARSLRFEDPLDGRERQFESQRSLQG